MARMQNIGRGLAMSRSTSIAFMLCLCSATWANASRAAEDVWAASYDAATGIRYIPLELILGAEWSGKREIAMPRGSFTEGIARDPSTWYGPSAWQHPDTGANLMVYDRTRRGVGQKFTLRTDNTAIGRVADSRFGISSCDQEAKYPLGDWKQGETREFHYRCWYASAEGKRMRMATSSITIEKIAFDFAGSPLALQIRWILKHADDPHEVDNRVYVFAPGRGAVAVR
jgi:hypothetical protein